MGILTHIVAAEEDEVVAIGDSLQPLEEWNGIERRGLDGAKMATLHMLLTGDDYDQALCLYEPIYAGAEGALVMRIADQVIDKLATLDEDALSRVAEELSATEEFEFEQWDTEEVEDTVMALAELAQLAQSQEQVLFVWMYSVLT